MYYAVGVARTTCGLTTVLADYMHMPCRIQYIGHESIARDAVSTAYCYLIVIDDDDCAIIMLRACDGLLRTRSALGTAEALDP